MDLNCLNKIVSYFVIVLGLVALRPTNESIKCILFLFKKSYRSQLFETIIATYICQGPCSSYFLISDEKSISQLNWIYLNISKISLVLSTTLLAWDLYFNSEKSCVNFIGLFQTLVDSSCRFLCTPSTRFILYRGFMSLDLSAQNGKILDSPSLTIISCSNYQHLYFKMFLILSKNK